MELVRLSDGWGWRIPNKPERYLERPWGVTCDEVFVKGYVNNVETIARVKIGLLGPATPPDLDVMGKVTAASVIVVLLTMVTGCGDDCPDGYMPCDGECVDPNIDVMHCGGCGRACSAADGCASCRAGLCVTAASVESPNSAVVSAVVSTRPESSGYS